jgi:DNA-binding NarL/FixJ family response regulator
MAPVILLPNGASFDYICRLEDNLSVIMPVERPDIEAFRTAALIFRSKGLAREQIRPTIFSMEVSSLGRKAMRSKGNKPVAAERPRRQRIRLLLLHDHALFRESLARLLASERDFELLSECSTPSEALRSLKASKVDVLLVDLGMARDFIPCARRARYHGKSLVVAREIDVTASALVLKCGASGIFVESDSSSRLIQAIRRVANGEVWVDQRVIQLLAERFPQYEDRWWGGLTERERTVLNGVVDGFSNRKIGTQIGVSESTIKAAVQQLFNKAGVRTRSQLVRIALAGPIPSANAGHEIGTGA